MVKTMAKLRMAHASTHGALKPPGPKKKERERRAKVGNNNGQLRIATPPCVANANPPGPTFFAKFTFFRLLVCQKVSILHFGPGGLRAPCVLACAMRSLAIVFTIVQSFSLSFFLFPPSSAFFAVVHTVLLIRLEILPEIRPKIFGR